METDRNLPDSPLFQVYHCTRPGCGLRFTLPVDPFAPAPKAQLCPACRAALENVGAPFGRQEIRPGIGEASGLELEVLLDNIRSAWNVGSMLRTCDGAGVRRVHLCGVSASPENPKVAKTALGAERSLPWTMHPNGVEAARALKAQGMRLWALEGGERAVSIFESQVELPGAPVLLVAGNELSGVDPGILDLCERVVCLPMQGIKGSLNVAVAFGAAVYYLRFGRRLV